MAKEPSESDRDTTPTTLDIKFFGGDEEEGQRQEILDQDQTKVTFGFPILDLTRDIPKTNIPPSTLQHFHGMTSEDTDSFLFEFDILCGSYSYIRDAQNLKLFPPTLKYSTLRWFMGLRNIL